jgi:hypothetical protein
MTQGADTRLDGSTLVVRIPMRFQRRGGRKRIVAPDGSQIVPSSKPQPDGTLVKALARAWRWQRMLDDGVYTSVSEIGYAENISKSYISRILRLALLAPDIVEAILAGRMDQGLMLERLEQSLPATGRCSANTRSAHAPLKKRAALAPRLHASPESRRRQARSSEAGRP